jgi:hypothetical protein
MPVKMDPRFREGDGDLDSDPDSDPDGPPMSPGFCGG